MNIGPLLRLILSRFFGSFTGYWPNHFRCQQERLCLFYRIL